MDFEVRSMTEADWESYRDIRLEMLLDTPMAFGESFDSANARTEAGWRERLSSSTGATSIRFAAILPGGGWIGSMGGFVDGALGPVLVGVYVTPRFRGDEYGVTTALLTAVEDWARLRSSSIRLDVHESNLRARASYAKRGWVETGSTQPYPLDPLFREIEMVKQLG